MSETKKSQFKMYRLPGPIKSYPLPEGYTVRNYKGEEDIAAWCEICLNGLVGSTDPQNFVNAISSRDDCDPYSDVFFICDENGRPCATVTAIKQPDGTGDMHMVSVLTEYRGKGLGNCLAEICIRSLQEREVKYIYLTTDEWRVAAVKSYLTSGFLPVEYNEGMTDRWLAEMELYGIDRLTMLSEDCKYLKTLTR
ncbi:MAG: GNAT family N-acetyltransferase [Clostridia bacterium]|nr:GNAT family N-acetyltransferase [Clostridia bacterium]